MHQLERLLIVFHENQWENTFFQGTPEFFSHSVKRRALGSRLITLKKLETKDSMSYAFSHLVYLSASKVTQILKKLVHSKQTTYVLPCRNNGSSVVSTLLEMTDLLFKMQSSIVQLTIFFFPSERSLSFGFLSDLGCRSWVSNHTFYAKPAWKITVRTNHTSITDWLSEQQTDKLTDCLLN